MPVRHARQCTTALTTITLAAAIVIAMALASSHEFGGLTAGALLVCVGAATLALDISWRAVDRTAGRVERLAAECEAARRASLTDPLTGLGNRRQFDQRLGEAVVAALRFGEPFSVVLFDLDDFKRVNDLVGHAAGDSALRHVAAVLTSYTREFDVACRWGGEEFALLLPRTRAGGATQVAERALRSLRATVVDVNGAEVRVTASAGVAEFPRDGVDGPLVLDAADSALLRAKALGKDQVQRARTEDVDLTSREHVPHASA